VVAVAAVFLVHPPPGRDCPRGVEMRPERERLAPPAASEATVFLPADSDGDPRRPILHP